MPASSGQRSRRQSASGRADYLNPGMRVSDTERSEVADRLSKHYGDGRLDQAEFDRRLDQAMKATTRADLDGLFADLPGGAPSGRYEPAETEGPARPPRRRPHIGLIIVAIVAAVIIGPGVGHFFYFPWLLIAVLAFIWLRHIDTRRRRY
jgi:Domain of unknown function (DUF1707)